VVVVVAGILEAVVEAYEGEGIDDDENREEVDGDVASEDAGTEKGLHRT
jgi:hypothetical protein